MSRQEDLAGYLFQLPEWWGEPTRIDGELALGFDSFATHDLALLVRVMLAAGTDEGVKEYLEATRERWAAEIRKPSEMPIAGVTFTGESAYGCEDAHSVETLAAAVGTDLVAFHIVYLAKSDAHAKLRRLVRALVEGALLAKWGRQDE